MTGQNVNKKNILDLPIVNIIAFFIALVVNVYLYSVISFSLITISVVMFYCFLGNTYSGILVISTVTMFVLDIVFFKQKYGVYIVMLEYMSVLCLCLILEMYKIKCDSIKKCFFERYNGISKEIVLIDYEIFESKKAIADLTQSIRDFEKIGEILQSLQVSFGEKNYREIRRYCI